MKYGVLDQGRWVERAMQQMKNWGWGTIDDNWDHGRFRQRSKAFLAYCGRLGGLMYFRHGVLCIVFREDFS